LKAELTLPNELVDLIADKVIEKLRPLLLNNSKAEDVIMTIDETAGFLKTSKGQLYQWVNNAKHGLKTFPYLKSGKRLMFSKQALITWMNENKNR
jgi:hypothetical protein